MPEKTEFNGNNAITGKKLYQMDSLFTDGKVGKDR